jgi:hypothetical protein
VLTLEELPLVVTPLPPPPAVCTFAEEGLRRSRAIDCFDFVPTDYATVYAVLSALSRGSFCEWGSGMGIVTGIAEMLGYQARGIEIHADLAAASRTLLRDFGLHARIETGDYLAMTPREDIHFVYCWPGQTPRVEAHFLSATPATALLLYCSGAADIRCRRKVPC